MLKLNSHDSSALAINVNGLTSYLVDLTFAKSNSNEEILKHDFGMPFNDIKNGKFEINKEQTEKLVSGISSIYDELSDEEKESFVTSLLFDLNERMKGSSKANKENYNKELEINTESFARLAGLVTKLDAADDDKYTFNPLTLLAFEASSLNQIYKLSFTNKKLKSEISKIGNNFYNTIEYCLSELAKQSLENVKVGGNDLANEGGEMN